MDNLKLQYKQQKIHYKNDKNILIFSNYTKHIVCNVNVKLNKLILPNSINVLNFLNVGYDKSVCALLYTYTYCCIPQTICCIKKSHACYKNINKTVLLNTIFIYDICHDRHLKKYKNNMWLIENVNNITHFNSDIKTLARSRACYPYMMKNLHNVNIDIDKKYIFMFRNTYKLTTHVDHCYIINFKNIYILQLKIYYYSTHKIKTINKQIFTNNLILCGDIFKNYKTIEIIFSNSKYVCKLKMDVENYNHVQPTTLHNISSVINLFNECNLFAKLYIYNKYFNVAM